MIEAALDTSHGLGLAVMDEGTVLAGEYLPPAGRQNRETLTPWLKGIFERCELSPTRVARWTVGLGPGSFTGIRIGLAFVKGVCLQSAGQVRGIPTSYAMARQAAADLPPGAEIAVLNDARRQQVIATIYRKHKNGIETIREAHIPDPEALKDICTKSERLVTLQPEPVAANLPGAQSNKLLDLGALHAEYLLEAPDNLYQIDTAGDLSSQALPVYVRPAVFVKPQPVKH